MSTHQFCEVLETDLNQPCLFNRQATQPTVKLWRHHVCLSSSEFGSPWNEDVRKIWFCWKLFAENCRRRIFQVRYSEQPIIRHLVIGNVPELKLLWESEYRTSLVFKWPIFERTGHLVTRPLKNQTNLSGFCRLQNANFLISFAYFCWSAQRKRKKKRGKSAAALLVFPSLQPIPYIFSLLH